MKKLLLGLLVATTLVGTAQAGQQTRPADMPPNIQYGIPDHIVPYGSKEQKEQSAKEGDKMPAAPKNDDSSQYVVSWWFAVDENTGVCVTLERLMPAETPQQAEFLMQATGLNVMTIRRGTHIVSIVSKDNPNLAPFTLTNDLRNCKHFAPASDVTGQR